MSKLALEVREFLPAKADGSPKAAAIEKLSELFERNLLSPGVIKNGAACECMLLSLSSSLFELMEKKCRKQISQFQLFQSNNIVGICFIYLSEPFPSFPPKYLLSLSPTESLLCSSDGKLWLPHTNSIGSDLTSSFKRFGGDGVKLSLSVDDEDNPLPFDALLVKLFGAAIE